MTWQIRLRDPAMQERIVRVSNPEKAIEVACQLMDDGWIVASIGEGSLAVALGHEEFARIYAIWARAKSLFGAIPVASAEGSIPTT